MQGIHRIYRSVFEGRRIQTARERLIVALLSAFAFSMIANAFAYFNFYPIHDAANNVILLGRSWQLRLGRFLLPAYATLRGVYAMPWLCGLLSMLYLGLSVYMIATLMGQDTLPEIALLAGLLSANGYAMELNALHQYYSDVFMLALLLACAGVYAACRMRGWKRFAAAGTWFFLSFGVYPAFITTAACLFALVAVKRLLDDGGFTRALWREIFAWAAVLLAAGIVYMVAAKLVNRLLHLRESDVRWSIFAIDKQSVSALLESVRENYRAFAEYFFDGRRYAGLGLGVAHIALAIVSAALFCRAGIGRVKASALAFIVLLAALFPLVSRLVNVFTGRIYAQRTMFAQYLMAPILLWLAFWSVRAKPAAGKGAKLAALLAAAMALVVILGNVRYANSAYTAQRLLYDRASYHTGRVIEDLREATGGVPDTDVAVVGVFELDSDYDNYLHRFGGKDSGVTYGMVLANMANVLGYEFDYDEDLGDELRERDDVKAMPSYPNAGYIGEIDGHLVIKLSD